MVCVCVCWWRGKGVQTEVAGKEEWSGVGARACRIYRRKVEEEKLESEHHCNDDTITMQGSMALS